MLCVWAGTVCVLWSLSSQFGASVVCRVGMTAPTDTNSAVWWMGDIFGVQGHVCIWDFFNCGDDVVVVVCPHTVVLSASLQGGMKGLYTIWSFTSCVMSQQCITSEGPVTVCIQYSGVSFHRHQLPLTSPIHALHQISGMLCSAGTRVLSNVPNAAVFKIQCMVCVRPTYVAHCAAMSVPSDVRQLMQGWRGHQSFNNRA